MVSPRKTLSSANLTMDDCASTGASNKLQPLGRKSCENLYSAPSSLGSAAILYRPKMPMGFATRPPALIPATSEVRQRVMSARRLRQKTMENQIGLAQKKITELTNELRVLRTLHKRQNSALAKYESTNAELPRLLNAHAEEIRMWQTKHRNLQTAHKDLALKLKQKEAIILALGDKNKYYSQLNKDKNLEDRHRLAEKLQSFELRLQEKENQMKLADRRAHLEIKNLRQQLLTEQRKTKDVMQKLEKARIELSNYRKLDELNITEKMSSLSLKQANVKVELKSGIKKLHREKPLGGVLNGASKSPSPVHGESVGEEDESDYSISHRSQKSTSSSTNLDFKTTRTVRKLTPSLCKKIDRDAKFTVASGIIGSAEFVGDGPELMKKSEKLRMKKQLATKQRKMMVNMPDFDEGGDADTIATTEDESDIVAEDGTKANSELDNDDNDDVDCNYDEDDFDENDEEKQQHHIYLNQSAKIDDSDGKSQENELNHDHIDYEEDEVNPPSGHIKQDILNIRKQISDDYKEREAFLDTFCRQATSSGLRSTDDPTKLGTNNTATHNNNINNNNNNNESAQPAANRKNKLLAALKAIDDDQRSIQD